MTKRPIVLGIGGGGSRLSTTEQALRLALAGAEAKGAHSEYFGVADIMALPLYTNSATGQSAAANRLVDLVRRASGMIIASPGYHGSVSGALKNAIDYLQDTADDDRPYLSDMPVGLIAVAGGHQAAVSTLIAMRTIVHALRGWPTPLGVAVNSQASRFADDRCDDEAVSRQLVIVGQQVFDFIDHWMAAAPRGEGS